MPNSSSIQYDEPTTEQYISQLINFFDKRYTRRLVSKYKIQEVIADEKSPLGFKTRQYNVSNLRFHTELDGQILASEYNGKYNPIRILNMLSTEDGVNVLFHQSQNVITISLPSGYIKIYY